ncbi:TolC family protein [Pseudomonas sp. NPDC087346]|uniref:TolC family protein n=1 Tax=Pseudomonas sp. NPDC087346 TaxID=3364438 RepID=UPI0037F310D3
MNLKIGSFIRTTKEGSPYIFRKISLLILVHRLVLKTYGRRMRSMMCTDLRSETTSTKHGRWTGCLFMYLASNTTATHGISPIARYTINLLSGRPQLAGWIVGLLVLASQCCAASQPQQINSAPSEAFLGLQQLWLMTRSPEGQLELEHPMLPKDMASEEPIDSLSLEEARRRSFDESFTLGASRSKVQASSDLARAAYAGVLPSLDIRMAKGRGNSTPSMALDEATGAPLSSSIQTQTEIFGVLSQPLFNLSAMADIRNAAAIKRASAADADGVQSDVNYDTTAAFYSAVEAALSLKISLAQQKRLEKLGEWVTARAEAGGASGADRERIKARVLAAKSAVQDALAQANQANINLSRLTGSMPRALRLPALADLKPLGTLEGALALVSDGNPAVRTARENEEAARQERRKYQGRFVPAIKLELSSNRVANAGGLEGWREERAAMVVLTLPLFSGGADYYRQRASLAKQQGYEYERLDAEREAQRNLQVAFSGLASSRDKINSLRQQAQAQAQVVAAFDSQLSSSTRNLLDVFDAYQQYNQSQLELVHTSVQSVLLEQQIQRVTGQLAANAFATMSSSKE